MAPEDYELLTVAWRQHLRAGNKSERTISSYLTGVRLYAAWCASQGTEPELSRRSVEAFVASLLDSGRASATASQRLIAVRLFSAWLADEGETSGNELAAVKAPRLDQKVVEHLTTDQMIALLRACAGSRFPCVRDTALVRFMHSTGARADEVVSMKTYDLQVGAQSAVIVRGKGGKGRRVGYPDRTAEALVRYLRARRRHPRAYIDALWLCGQNGRRTDVTAVRGGLTYEGLTSALERRAATAGVGHFHLHRLRHTAAVDWLRSGRGVPGLMAQMGWESVDMVRRYIKAAESDLAVAEAQRPGLGEF